MQTFGGIRCARAGATVSSAAGTSRTAIAANSPSNASGAWTTKIARQPNACVRTPPSAGPSAAPNVPASVQIVAPRSVDPVNAVRTGNDAARSNAAPAP